MSARLRNLRYRSLKGLARDRLDHTKAFLDVGDVEPGNFLRFVFTADNTTNQLTIAGEDTLAADSPRAILVGDLPAELATGTLYWVGDAGLNLYQLYPTKADAVADTNAITFTDDGTGTLEIIFLD